MSWGLKWVQLRIYSKEEVKASAGGRGGGNSFGWGTKGRVNDNIRLWNGSGEGRGFIPLLVQSPFLPWPPLSIWAFHLFSVLSFPCSFQHPIMASACCLSCGVHGWKWLGTSNHWREKEGRELKEREWKELTSIFGRKNGNITNEHNKGGWPLKTECFCPVTCALLLYMHTIVDAVHYATELQVQRGVYVVMW